MISSQVINDVSETNPLTNALIKEVVNRNDNQDLPNLGFSGDLKYGYNPRRQTEHIWISESEFKKKYKKVLKITKNISLDKLGVAPEEQEGFAKDFAKYVCNNKGTNDDYEVEVTDPNGSRAIEMHFKTSA